MAMLWDTDDETRCWACACRDVVRRLFDESNRATDDATAPNLPRSGDGRHFHVGLLPSADLSALEVTP